MRSSIVGLLLVASASSFVGCATYEDELGRSQRAFDASEHERALAILRALEPESGRLSTSDRAHYAYLRGMTDYRIGYKIDARHWLGIAAAIEQGTPGSIPPESVARLNEALKEMNEAVYASGVEALSNDITAASTSAKSKAAGPAVDEDESAHGADAPAPKKKSAPKADPDPQ
jgi:hypothetical protein